MRNIKISFEHPAYIYPFKLNITSPSVNEVDRISCKLAEQSLQTLRQEIILSNEQQKILSSFSLLFKVEFVNQYNSKLNERKPIDYLGPTNHEQYSYFAKLCSSRITVKEILQLNHYIKRLAKIKINQAQFSYQLWLNLVILFHTNFITGQQISSEKESIHQQLQAFVALSAIVDSINSLIVNDRTYSIPLRKILPTIQDSIIQGYLALSNLHLQEQALFGMLTLARSLLNYLKERLTIDEKDPEYQETILGKKNVPSLIFWIINFIPHPKAQSKFDMLFNSLNKHTILELLSKLLAKTTNLVIIQQCILFINTLFQEVSVFGQLLFLITEAIRFELPKTLSFLSYKIKARQLKSASMIKYNLQCELSEIFGKSTIEPFRLKEMVKIQKNPQKIFNATLKDVNKAVTSLVQDFQRYKKGKVLFKKKKKVGNLYQQQIEQRQILNIQKLAEQSHLHYKSQQIISMELFRQNQQLIKVNRWLQEKLKKNQAIIAQLLSLNQKDNARAKLKLCSGVLSHRLEASQHSVRFSDIISSHSKANPQRVLNDFHLKRTSSREILDQKLLRESRQDIIVHHRSSRQEAKNYDMNNRPTSKYVLPLNSQSILSKVPRIDVPRQRQRRNSIGGLKQIQMSRTSLIYQQAASQINKKLQEQQKNKMEQTILPPPPPLPDFLQLPPPPSLNGFSQLPPPPLFQLPPLNSLDLPPLLFLPPLNMLNLPPLTPAFNLQPQKTGPKIEMKNIGWNTLQGSKIKNSFWQHISEPKLDLNKDEIVHFFSKNQKNFVISKPVTPQFKTILKPDRIKNVEIIMKKMKITESHFPLIEDAFRSYDDRYLNQQFLTGILNLLPTSKQKGEYLQVTFQGESWALADKFLAFLSKIDSLQDKINSILFKQEFFTIAISFFNKVEVFITFYQQVKEDKFFQTFLQFMLAVGNFLNNGTNRGNARAFRIENIQKSYMLIGQDKQTTLFDYILQQMYQQDASIFEWPSIANKPYNIVPLSVLCEDYNYFEKKCELVNQCIILSQEDPLDESAPYFLPFYMTSREEVSVMKNRLEFASVLFKTVKQFYGDKLQSEEMAKLIIDFRNRVIQWKSKSKNRKADKK